MKCIVKIFVLSVFVVRIFGSQYEVTVHGLDEKYKSEEWNCLYKHDLTKKYYYIQFEKKPEYSQIKQNSKIECSKPFALGFVHWVPDSSLYIKFMNNRLKTERSIPLSSYGVQLLYDQFQKDEKYWFLQFELKNNKVHSIE